MEGLQPGEIRWAPDVRYGQRYQGRPRDLWVNVALCWRRPRHVDRRPRRQQAEEPWYLATSQTSARQAVTWDRQRFWIEESFKDSTSRFRLKYAQIGCPARLTRLLMALTIVLCWLTLFALPELHALPEGYQGYEQWSAAVCVWGQASLISLALTVLDTLHDLPLPWFQAGTQ